MEEAMQKRSEIRRSTIVPTEVASPYWRESLDLIAADLSPRGMYLISEEMPHIGDCLYCSFSLSSEEPEYNFFSRVKRINWHRRETDRIRPGFGVEFLDVTPRKFLGLERALRGLPPPIPSKRRNEIPRPVVLNDGRPGGTFVSNWYWHETNRRLLEQA
jgi:hypothetical protein